MEDNPEQQIGFLGQDQNESSCVLVSTLVKVTEQFLSTVNSLKQAKDKRSNEEQLAFVMEQYERLNMVIRVLKLAYPVLLNDANEKSAMDSAIRNVTATAINSLSKVGEQQYQRGQQFQKDKHLQLEIDSQMHQHQTTEKAPQVNQHQLTEKDQTIHSRQMMEKKPQVHQRQIVTNIPHQQTTTAQMVQSKDMRLDSVSPTKVNTESTNISSNVFLDQFETTARSFATQNNMEMTDVWESLFVHALPQDKIKWAENTILNKSLNWNTARKYYLKAYPDIQLQQSIKPFKYSEPPVGPSASITEAATRINHPAPQSRHVMLDEKKRMVERQSLYAERLLSLEMKEYESIYDYNQKFHRYSNAACMNLNDTSLSKRYIHSLLPKYRLMVEKALANNPPGTLSETMDLAKNLIRVQEMEYKKLQGKVCWKHPDQKRRSNGEDNLRPLKKSSCA